MAHLRLVQDTPAAVDAALADAALCQGMAASLLVAADLLRRGRLELAREHFCLALSPVWHGDADRLLDGEGS